MTDKDPAHCLHCGDNLDLLHRMDSESVDLCYFDPPFYSQRNYFLSQSTVTKTRAFSDVWRWDQTADWGWDRLLLSNHRPLSEVLGGLRLAMGQSGLLAYLVSLSLRIAECHRLLKPSGSLYLHCDPSASHYLKLICDMIFCAEPNKGRFLNEIIWHYQTGGASRRHYAQKHDVILFYARSDGYYFCSDEIREPRSAKSLHRAANPKGARITAENSDRLPTDVFAIPALNPMSRERLGYPTQKPEALLERLIRASSRRGDLILDPYCGSGTSLAVAARLGRIGVGIDSNPAAIELAPPPSGGGTMNRIDCGDNLPLLRALADQSVDLCYGDPPFFSQRNYYRPKSNKAEFTDHWSWDDAAVAAWAEVSQGDPALRGILIGFKAMMGETGLLAYLLSLSLRLVEIQRVLKPSGSLYLHCDPTASHYLKLLCDAVFCQTSPPGVFVNEIIWCYKSGGASKNHFSRKHDTVLFYAKSRDYGFNFSTEKSYNRGLKPYRFQGVEEFKDELGWYTMVGMRDYWLIDMVGRTARERLGYPTQKPEALLERIISASSNPGDLVLDPYCGSGTTLAVAKRLGRQWLGFDSNSSAVTLAMARLGL